MLLLISGDKNPDNFDFRLVYSGKLLLYMLLLMF